MLLNLLNLDFTIFRLNEKRILSLVQANEETIDNPRLLKQLKEEGKYNYWISVYDFKTKTTTAPLPTVVLPICDDPNKYITKWFYKDFNTALKQAVKELKEML